MPRSLHPFGRAIHRDPAAADSLARRFLVAATLLLSLIGPRGSLLASEWTFRRGDTNGDGIVNLADVVRALDSLLIVSSPTSCADACDANDDGTHDLQDPLFLLEHLLQGAAPPPPPFEECAHDPTDDTLLCEGPVSACPPALPPIVQIEGTPDAVEDSPGASLIAHPTPNGPDAFAAAISSLRAVTIDLGEPGSVGPLRITSSAPEVRVFLPTGTLVPLPIEIQTALLPLPLLVGVAAPTDATLRVIDLESGASDAVRLRGLPRARIVGHTEPGSASFRRRRTFPVGAPGVEIALDPSRFSDRYGTTCDVYVVPHRSTLEWGFDPLLVDVSGGFETVTCDANPRVVWDAPLDAGPRLARSYDVVLDFDRDGLLGAGDLLDGGDLGAAFHVVHPLDLAGPHPVAIDNHSGGPFLTQRTYYPSTIDTLPAAPLVVISHGSGHLYTWYDYLGEHLASYGYVVTSHQNDTLPGIETAASSTIANTDSFLERLDTIAGGALDGRIDPSRIAWIGHSRGGEGALRALDRLVDGLSVPQHFDVEAVRAVAAISPTAFLDREDATPHDRPFHLIAGGADGDVTGGVNCAICQFFRLSRRGTGPVGVTYVHGASHNDFNCCGILDGLGPDQIDGATAQRIARATLLAFLENHLRGDPATYDFLALPHEALPLSPTLPPVTIARQFTPGLSSGVLTIDDFQEVPAQLAMSSTGWGTATDFVAVDEVALTDGDGFLFFDGIDPANGMTQADPGPDADRGLVLGWSLGGEGAYTWNVPASAGDWRTFAHLSLRAAQMTRHPATEVLDGPLGFSLELLDVHGTSALVPITEVGRITRTYPRVGLGVGAGWSNEFVTIRLPLERFTDDSPLDLSRITTVRLRGGAAYGSSTGRVCIDDVLLER